MGVDGVKLQRIAGYVSETPPLKIGTRSLRRPARARARAPFCYSDILRALAPGPAWTPKLHPPVPVTAPTPASTSTTKALPPPPAPVPLARALARSSTPASATETPIIVHELGLWAMGSRAPDGAYVICGRVSLGGGGVPGGAA
ncbi:hypothetical protein D9615_009411 [Tricholomella constricta]|uniref:Uncharacterized protein n=1 Tax=Tricholomella constricta TaxID=117010 RepID=A0A8H5H2Y6_9AGAR|nr:hypothetical protein D9615_009411 [Tricholomella constricta]